MAKVEFEVGQVVSVLEGAFFGEKRNPRELKDYKVKSFNGTSVYLVPVDDEMTQFPARFNRKTLTSKSSFGQSAFHIILDKDAYFEKLDEKKRIRRLKEEILVNLKESMNEETLKKVLALLKD